MSLPHFTYLCLPSATRRSCLPSASGHCTDVNFRLDHKGYDPDQVELLTTQVRLKEQIKRRFDNVKVSVSTYDTAWVAMVPSPSHNHTPCFPQCLNWLLENQLPDGSWVSHCHPHLKKDALSSTLACAIALKKWNVGEDCVRRGLNYIESNNGSITDEEQLSTVGFDIIFPGMVELANEFGLEIPLKPEIADVLSRKRIIELDRSEGRTAYLAFVSEGLGKLQNWTTILNYQKKNGSLFDSPATTAAVLSNIYDSKCLNYLESVLKSTGSAVPTMYPSNLFGQLCLVDTLDRLGIDRHFEKEIASVMEEIFRCWQHGDDEILLDPATCAMTFRSLLVRGYHVSSDSLSRFADRENFFSSLEGYISDVNSVLELYKASETVTVPGDMVLENINSWTRNFLKNEASNAKVHVHERSLEKVDYALKFPYSANLQRLANKRYIEHFVQDDFYIRKTAYWFNDVNKEDILNMAVKDFKICQSLHIDELQYIVSWVKENKLDQLKFARQKASYCYFSAAATIFAPELSEARICWAKNSILTTVVDDFFDIGGTREELVNLIHLVRKWDKNSASECSSEHVEIIFLALFETLNSIGAKASELQGRPVTEHLIEIWLQLLNSMMQEFEWSSDKYLPTMDEYMDNSYVSFALGPIILPALYFVGSELSEKSVKSADYHMLFKLTSMFGRLQNDLQGYKRELQEGKLNSFTLRMAKFGNEDDSVREKIIADDMRREIDGVRRELLRLVVKSEGLVPRKCKDLFWNMLKVLSVFYLQTDGFTSPKEMLAAVKAVIHEPLDVPPNDDKL